MPGAYMWVWDSANSKFIKAVVSAAGYLKVLEQNLDADGLIQQSAHHKGYNYGSSAWNNVGITANHELKVAMTGLDDYILKSLFNANTILYATADDTPVALTVAASRILGRKASGDICAMTETELRALLSLAAADIPDLAATKITSGDLAAARMSTNIVAAILGLDPSVNTLAVTGEVVESTSGSLILKSEAIADAGVSVVDIIGQQRSTGAHAIRCKSFNAAADAFIDRLLITGRGAVASVYTEASNFGIGTKTAGTNTANVLVILNGTPPASSPANTVQLYAEDVANLSELKARDENGDIATLTPHNFSLFTPDPSYYYPWSYYAKNPYLGKEINVDMEGAIRAIQDLTGKQFIYTRDLPDSEKEDWEANQRLNVELAEKERIEKIVEVEMKKEIEILMVDAFEEIEITERVKTGTKIAYEMIESIGTIKPVRIDVFKDKRTGKFAKKLKSSVRFDTDTGKFYRFRTREEVLQEI